MNNKKIVKYTLIVFTAIVVIVVLIPNTPEQKTHKERIDSIFSTWNGEPTKLTAYIKSKLDDPHSFEHVSANYLDAGDHITITEKFRAKNKFGALVLNEVEAKCDTNGNVIELVQ